MKLRFFILCLFSSLSASAATLYCGPAATLSGSGADFNNLKALPNTTAFVRGNTYVLVDGSYSGTTFSTLTNSTTLITVRKASSADSAVAGYSASLHDGAAAFGGMSIQTGYWVIDGVTRSGWNTGYGFTVATGSTIQFGENFTKAVTNVTMKYVQCKGTYPTPDGKRVVQVIGPHDLITFNHCHFYDAGESVIHAKGVRRITVEYCELSRNNDAGGTHSELIVITDSRSVTLRYNIFDQAKSTSGIATPAVGNFGCLVEEIGSLYVYGNIFRGPYGTTFANGALYIFSTDMVGDFYICNNSYWGVTNAFSGPAGGTNSCVPLLVAQNNLFYQATTGIAPYATANTFSHNAYFNSVLANVRYGTSALTNGSGNPLNDANNDDFGLTPSAAAAMDAGVSLSVSGHTFDVDMNGNTRGADGKWDRGAVEYQESGSGFPPVITSSLTKVATNGIAVSYSITTSNAAVSYGATPLPLGVSRSGAVLSGTPTGVVAYTTNTTITATNEAGTDSETLVWSVYNGLPPTLTTSPSAKTNSEATGVVLTSVADTTYGTATYQWQSNSVNISGATSANYSKVPAVEAVDSALYRVIASNSWGSVTSSAVYVSITNASLPPVITASNISGTINVAMSYQISATEGPTAFGATGLQTGLSLNAGTGLISGTPTVASTNSVTISATNAYGYDQETVTFSVASLVSSNITVGSRVMVNIDPSLRVRDAAALTGNVLGTQAYLAEGTVTAGPTTADGYTWWEIDYDTAPDGWSIEGSGSSYWLVVASPGGDLTNPTVSITGPTSDPTWATNRVFVTISGTASDNVAVAAVNYNFHGVDFGTVTGTTSWTHDLELPATSGSYVFQVTAIDTSNNRATNQITLNLTMPFIVSVGTLRANNLRVGQ